MDFSERAPEVGEDRRVVSIGFLLIFIEAIYGFER